MKNILLLNAGTRNILVRNFIETVNGKCKIVVTDNFKLAPSLYEVSNAYVTPRWDEDGYWQEVKEICRKENIGLIVSLVDPELELLAEQKDDFEKMGILVNIGDIDVIKDTFDKYKTIEFLRKNKFSYIKSYITYGDAIRALDVGEVSFPLITKPRKGSGSSRIEKVDNKFRLKQLCELYDDILIQEFINGQEIGVDVYIDLISKDVISIFAKKKIKMRAGETDKSVSFKDDMLFNLITKFAKEFGLNGVNDIDVFEKNGTYYISEVNPRFGGGYIHAYGAGVNFPQFLINNMNGIINSIDIGNYKENLYMMKYFAVSIRNKDDLL